MEGKIIAVWGSPHSGKTTFATKLATAIYSSFESTVITLYTDLQTPMIPVLFPFDKPEDLGSVGYHPNASPLKIITEQLANKANILRNNRKSCDMNQHLFKKL